MQDVTENVKINSHNRNRYPLLYKHTEISTSSFGQILECRKCNILVVTWALVLCLIYMPKARGPVALGLWAYISGKALVPMLQLLHKTLKILHDYV